MIQLRLLIATLLVRMLIAVIPTHDELSLSAIAGLTKYLGRQPAR